MRTFRSVSTNSQITKEGTTRRKAPAVISASFHDHAEVVYLLKVYKNQQVLKRRN